MKRNKIVADGVDDQWQVDLVDINSLAKSNNGNRYILTCIAILSKCAWAFPMKMKVAEHVIKIFDKIFTLGRFPLKKLSDQGREFNNTSFQKYMKQSGVQ